MKRVTILVAVYNGEGWLSRCLDSLLAQTYGSIEIVCVDDASTDGSLSLIEKYAAEYSNIKFASLPVNSGQAVARNVALGLSRGDYVLMVDCDDWLSRDAVERAVRVLDENPDTGVVLMNLVYHYGDTGEQRPFVNKCTDSVLDGYEAMRLSLTWDIHGVYMARRCLYDRYPFDASALLYSDDNTTRRHYLHAGRVRFCEGVYYYYQHAASLTHAPGIRYTYWLEAVAGLKRMLVEEGCDDALICSMEYRLWQTVVAVAGYYWRNKNSLTGEQRRDIWQRIRAHWAAVEFGRLPLSFRCKFGYWPLSFSFGLFMQQERLYFWLRKIVKGI